MELIFAHQTGRVIFPIPWLDIANLVSSATWFGRKSPIKIEVLNGFNRKITDISMVEVYS